MRTIVAACLTCLLIAGCARQKKPASSSLDREAARRVATAAALLTRGEVIAVAPTGSMEPTFDGRSFVVVERCATEDLREGDIVLRKVAGYALPVVHRIVGVDPIVTQGDANGSEDTGTVTDATLEGRVVCVVFGR